MKRLLLFVPYMETLFNLLNYIYPKEVVLNAVIVKQEKVERGL